MRQQMQVMEERDEATVQQMVVSHSSEVDTSSLHEPQMRPVSEMCCSIVYLVLWRNNETGSACDVF